MEEFIFNKIQPRNGLKGYKLQAYDIETFMRGAIRASELGYTLRLGESFSSLTGYTAHFDTPNTNSDVDEVITTFMPEDDTAEEPKKVVGVINMDISEARTTTSEESKIEVDMDKVVGMGDDKKALDLYAETLGVKLNRSKTFKNMLKDLKKGLEV